MNTSAPLDVALATERVLGWQTKLHRWAGQDEQKPFGDLFNLLCDPATLLVAWERVKRNRGSKTAGVDGQTRWHVEQLGVEKVLGELRQSLEDGLCSVAGARARVPKRGPGRSKARYSRLARQDRSDGDDARAGADGRRSFGRAPWVSADRRARRREQVRFFINPPRSYEWAIEGDVEDCFGSIHQGLLMEQLRRRVTDKRVLRLIRQFLGAGIMRHGSLTATPSGSPQGAILSPLLANVALSVLDRRFEDAWNACTPHQRKWRMAKGHPSYRMIRYADDFVILVRGTKAQAQALRSRRPSSCASRCV